ncbi:MAG: hypothetical protein ACO1Q7_07110 [Gemmatimonas sp.]
MKILLRRIRGALGMAVTWTVVWSVLSVCSHAIHSTESGAFPSLTSFLWNATGWALSGAIGGLVFGVCLATDARPPMQHLSIRRAGVWGALSALAFPLAFEVGGRLLMHRPLSWFHAPVLSEYAVAGLLCGAALVAVARRSARQEPPAFATNADLDELSVGAFAPVLRPVSARISVRQERANERCST